METNRIEVCNLFVSAAKGGWLQPVESAVAWFRGLLDDRVMAFVTPAGEILTQRARGMERLALVRIIPVRTRANAEHLFPLEFDVSFGRSESPKRFGVRMNGPNYRVVHFKGKGDSPLPAYDQGDDVAGALTQFLGQSVRLVAIDYRGFPRQTGALEVYGEKAASLSLVDQHQVSILSTSSVLAVNKTIGLREDGTGLVDIRAFRPNIVVDGCADDDENRWREIEIGGVIFRWVKPIVRCAVTMVDQDLGVRRGPEPLRTLREIRQIPGSTDVWMGAYYVRYSDNGIIKVGDEVRITAP